MLFGLCGGLCAGKQSVAEYLVDSHSFSQIRLAKAHSTTPVEGEKNGRTFTTVNALLDFVTKRWQERWVTTDVWDEEILDVLARRPFFLLVSIDAPISLRWERFRTRQDPWIHPPQRLSAELSRCEDLGQSPPSLEQFVLQNDEHLYDQTHGLARLIDRAEVRLINATPSIPSLHLALRKLDLLNEQRWRPSWDQYFMQLASLAARRSNCMKRRVGCVLVREKRVISTGYNGTPRNLKNCNNGGCARCNSGQGSGHGLSTCLCIHAEENALLEAGRERIREGSILYCDTCPCLTCSIKITQVGITEVVYSQGYRMDQETAAVFENGGVKLRQFSPPRRGLVSLNDLDDKHLDGKP